MKKLLPHEQKLVKELDDFDGTLDQFISKLFALRKSVGGRSRIKTDAGYNNVTFRVERVS